MRRLAALIVCLGAAFLLFYASTATPPPRAAGAPANVFSAGRALSDISVIARAPHPDGSDEIAAVRTYLLGRMTAMGLHPRIQTADSVHERTFGQDIYAGGARVRNLIGVLPGRDPRLPALALMAHYDTVPGSPGAADDSAGVASALEVLRVIAARGQPLRDVVVILTDGEEQGLLGAQAFFDGDPLAAHLGFVINMESRGGGGRAAMFQTGTDDGGAIQLFARTAKRPSSASLLPFIYHYLPNDTDFTVSLAKGLPGYNLAFIGRQFDYHSPSSTVAALDKGSVQHMGDEAVGPALALAFSPTLPARTPDLVYGDIFGLGVVAYSPAQGWLILALAAGLVLIAAALAGRAGALQRRAVLIGLLTGPALLLGGGIALFAARELTGAGTGWFSYRPLLARFPIYEAAIALAALGSMALAAVLAGRRGRASGAWIGLLFVALAASAAVQAAAPLAAFVIVWPTLAGAACAALTGAGSVRATAPRLLAAVIATLAAAWCLSFLHAFLEGLDLAPVGALFAWLSLLSLWPFLSPAGERKRPAPLFAELIPAALVLLVGLAVALGLRLTSPWSARHPRAVDPMIVETGGYAYRASLAPVDAWTARFLGGPGQPFKGLPGGDYAAANQPGVAIQAAPIGEAPAPGGAVLTTRFGPGDRAVLFDISAQTPLRITFAGRAMPLLAPGRHARLAWRAEPGESLDVNLQSDRKGAAEIRYVFSSAGWPAGAAPIPPLDADHMAWGDAPPKTEFVGKLTAPVGGL